MACADELLDLLEALRQTTQFLRTGRLNVLLAVQVGTATAGYTYVWNKHLAVRRLRLASAMSVHTRSGHTSECGSTKSATNGRGTAEAHLRPRTSHHDEHLRGYAELIGLRNNAPTKKDVSAHQAIHGLRDSLATDWCAL